jgi:hypothetical protein
MDMTTQSILNERRPVAVNFADDEVIVTLSDGSKISNPLSWHGWLKQATPEQRAHYILGRESILWPDLDEGLDIEGMFRGVKPQHPRLIAE